MASRAVEEAVEGYLTANWTHSPILTENAEGDAPQDGSPFVVLSFPISMPSRVAMNQRLYREEGGFRIVIAVERSTGVQVIRSWGAELAGLFRDRKIGPVTCGVPSEPFTDASSDEGNYYTGSLVVPYSYQWNDPE